MINNNSSFDLTKPTLKIDKLIDNLNKNKKKRNKYFLLKNIQFQNLIIETKKKLKKKKVRNIIKIRKQKKIKSINCYFNFRGNYRTTWTRCCSRQ